MKTNRIIYCLVGALSFVNASYGAGETATTSKHYVDTTTQAILPAKMDDKIVTYGATTGSVGERDTVMEWDGVTGSTTGIITTNAIDEPLGQTQDKILNIPSSNVLSRGGDDGAVSSHHIYSSQNTFGDGLVDASTLNSAVSSVARQKFIRVDETGAANANGVLWQINPTAPTALTITKTMDATEDGVGYCYKSLNGDGGNDGNNNQSRCSNTIYNGMGTKSGEWATVFSYGTVKGKSVCSSLTPPDYMKYDKAWDDSVNYYNWGYIASSSENTTLNGEFASQTGNGNLSANQFYCWCKTDTLDGMPAVSRWVFINSHSSASDCAGDCANDCGGNVRDASAFRSGVFGSVAP